MDKLYPLGNDEDRDRLITILETSLEVNRATQFFAWTQGPLQSLLPHEILICGSSDPHSGTLRLRYFTATRYFKPEHFEAACHPRSGLIPKIVRHWHTLRRPCFSPAPRDEVPSDPAWQDMLQRLELKNMAAHGLLAPGGDVHAWFGLFRVPQPQARHALLLELLLPSMSAAYSRVLAQEAAAPASAVRVGSLLSRREVQVLELVRDGLSNVEIAERLVISVMTAKNHVQNIRTKLKARNRGQSVSEGLRLGLIRPQAGGRQEFGQ